MLGRARQPGQRFTGTVTDFGATSGLGTDGGQTEGMPGAGGSTQGLGSATKGFDQYVKTLGPQFWQPVQA